MIKTPFGNIVVSDAVPENTIYIVPPVERVRYLIEATGEEKEVMQWNAKQGAVIFNIGRKK